MKKRIVALVLAVLTLVLALGFAGCKKNDKTDWTTSQIRASWSSELLTSDP